MLERVKVVGKGGGRGGKVKMDGVEGGGWEGWNVEEGERRCVVGGRSPKYEEDEVEEQEEEEEEFVFPLCANLLFQVQRISRWV